MRSDFIDLTGKRFGRYIVLSLSNRKAVRDHCWDVLCDCGNQRNISGHALKSGTSTSCGCYSRERSSKPHKIISGVEVKHCRKCGEWKTLSSFHKHRSAKDGLTYECAKCGIEHARAYNKAHPDKARAWRENNPEKVRAISMRNAQKKQDSGYWDEPSRNLRQRIACRMRQCLKDGKKGKHWETLVGFTINDLKKHLTTTMPDGYTWDNLNELHIDHIIPISAFNIQDENCIDFKKCWSLRNLRLLPAKENLIKWDKLDKPFQPSLAMAV
jgi:hypothetical protein